MKRTQKKTSETTTGKPKPKRKMPTTGEIKESIRKPVEKEEVSFKEVFSTGSTLLDLACSGSRVRGGGIPSGIIIEIFGPSSAGKTSILVELSRSIQDKKGEVKFLDPEARLDKEYCGIYGVSMPEELYHRPDTVNEMFGHIWNWKPANPDTVNLVAADSLAALSTEMEMEDADKMGMKRAKDFSQNLRKSCRVIANKRLILACTNQEREGNSGLVTPGGRGIPYYASLRIRVFPDYRNSKIKKSKKIGSKVFEKIVGIRSICEVKKSSIDEPYRTCSVPIRFGYGIDDVMANLEFFKEATGDNKYNIFKKSFATIQPAIDHIEKEGLEVELREMVIDTWEDIREKFRIERKQKVRF